MAFARVTKNNWDIEHIIKFKQRAIYCAWLIELLNNLPNDFIGKRKTVFGQSNRLIIERNQIGID